MAQFRMSRRIDGEFTLNDGMEWTSFEDSIGMAADWRKSGYVWEIPYRSLLPRGLDNLLAVGRCMSSEGDAWDVTRVIPTAAMTGEAAGVAAAMTVEKHTTTHQLSVKELQQQLSSKCGFPLHFEDVGTSRPEKQYSQLLLRALICSASEVGVVQQSGMGDHFPFTLGKRVHFT
eukprot:TRINITY_DN9222_c0_g1_i5.p2 TRINITY_DN9222_c0_g1~~TRINITY_DN9222_c0_g1_i5.p2  ORF type:complete len:174 (+),score=23.95 TRINITY_DN9222_c0_g1_i5:120-641(+)